MEPIGPCEVSPPVAAPRGWVGDPFGWRDRPSGPDNHTGIDIGAPPGWPVLALFAGTVRAVYASGELSKYGNLVVLEHGPRFTGAPLFSLYAHLLQRPALERGQSVKAGQVIAEVGATGGTREDPTAPTRGPHLHLELLDRWLPRGKDLDRIDPAIVLEPLGLLLRRHSRIAIVRGSPADCGALALERRNGYPIPAPRVSAPSRSSAGVLSLAALWWLFGPKW